MRWVLGVLTLVLAGVPLSASAVPDDHAHGIYRVNPFWPNEQRIVDPEFGTCYEITTPTHSHTTTWNATDAVALIYYTDDCSGNPRYVYPGEQKQGTQHLSVEFVPN